ncbi:hypothetical protein A2T98_13440 [Nodularia spumigena CENA596]|uniref:Uncharacterized protein n=1 Tax=Nodularia spumigena CENA596 TaxID=1819295 RepID=A0A166J7U9_NODSP|nr:hypothetical protein A2T98_13440 [Nodularia spumigena CENA596]
MLITESLDVGAGLFKLLLVIEHICHSLRGVAIPALVCRALQHSALCYTYIKKRPPFLRGAFYSAKLDN